LRFSSLQKYKKLAPLPDAFNSHELTLRS